MGLNHRVVMAVIKRAEEIQAELRLEPTTALAQAWREYWAQEEATNGN